MFLLRQNYLLIYIIEKESLFVRYAPVNHLVKSLSHGRPMWKLRQGRSQSNIQQTLSCKVPETRPGPAIIPTAASSLGTSPGRAENPTSLTIGSTRDVRRETNLGTCLPFEPPFLTASVFGSWSVLSIFKRNRTWEGMTKGGFGAIYCSRIQLSKLATGRWVHAKYFVARISRSMFQ